MKCNKSVKSAVALWAKRFEGADEDEVGSMGDVYTKLIPYLTVEWQKFFRIVISRHFKPILS